MTNLQYGTYLFEHNPRRIDLSYPRRVVTQALPGRGAVSQPVGALCRSVRCEGEVFGPTAQTAMEKLGQLSAACNQTQPAWLHLPTGEKLNCWVSRFSYSAQGDGRVLSYLVEFVEERNSSSQGVDG